MLDTSSFTLPSQVVVYYKLYLKDVGRVINSGSSSRSTLRDNSGLVYTNLHGSFCYGKLVRILLSPNHDGDGYAVITPLHPCDDGICHDSVTNAKIDDHIVSLHSSRYDAIQFIF